MTQPRLACPECCCILQICCDDPASARQAYIDLTAADLGWTPEQAGQHWDWMHERDLTFAPKSFAPVIAEIAASAREHGHSNEAA